MNGKSTLADLNHMYSWSNKILMMTKKNPLSLSFGLDLKPCHSVTQLRRVHFSSSKGNKQTKMADGRQEN